MQGLQLLDPLGDLGLRGSHTVSFPVTLGFKESGKIVSEKGPSYIELHLLNASPRSCQIWHGAVSLRLRNGAGVRVGLSCRLNKATVSEV